jgi:hypothetical protein
MANSQSMEIRRITVIRRGARRLASTGEVVYEKDFTKSRGYEKLDPFLARKIELGKMSMSERGASFTMSARDRESYALSEPIELRGGTVEVRLESTFNCWRVRDKTSFNGLELADEQGRPLCGLLVRKDTWRKLAVPLATAGGKWSKGDPKMWIDALSPVRTAVLLVTSDGRAAAGFSDKPGDVMRHARPLGRKEPVKAVSLRLRVLNAQGWAVRKIRIVRRGGKSATAPAGVAFSTDFSAPKPGDPWTKRSGEVVWGPKVRGMILGDKDVDRYDDVMFKEIPFGGRPLEFVIANAPAGKKPGTKSRYGFQLLDESGKVMTGMLSDGEKIYRYAEGKSVAMKGGGLEYVRFTVSPTGRVAIYYGGLYPSMEHALRTKRRAGESPRQNLGTITSGTRTKPARGLRLVLFSRSERRNIKYVVVHRLKEWPKSFPKQR